MSPKTTDFRTVLTVTLTSEKFTNGTKFTIDTNGQNHYLSKHCQPQPQTSINCNKHCFRPLANLQEFKINFTNDTYLANLL
jgi:hypothetical protein